MTGPATLLFLACMGYFGAGKASTGPAMALSLIPKQVIVLQKYANS